MGKDSVDRRRKKAVSGRKARRSSGEAKLRDPPASPEIPGWLKGLRDRFVAQIPDLIGPDGHLKLSEDDKDAREKAARVLKALGHAAIEQFGDWLQEVGRKQATSETPTPEPFQNEELRRISDALREAIAAQRRTPEQRQPSRPEQD